jgi:hypothetical protein
MRLCRTAQFLYESGGCDDETVCLNFYARTALVGVTTQRSATGDGEQTHLEGSEVSDAGIAALRALGELEELTLGDTRLHGAIVDRSSWPRLRTLSLTGLDLTDQALPGSPRGTRWSPSICRDRDLRSVAARRRCQTDRSCPQTKVARVCALQRAAVRAHAQEGARSGRTPAR